MSQPVLDRDFFIALEERLLHFPWKDDKAGLDDMLAQNFVEVGPDGRRTERAGVVQWLLQKDADFRWQFGDVSLIRINDAAVLLTYHARQIRPASGSAGSRRSSVWISGEDGCWRLLFHQASRVQ